MTAGNTDQTRAWQARWTTSMMNNYGTPPLALVSGDGAVVTDVDGNTYVDLLAGIAVERLYRGFAARNPQLGPFRDTSKCGCCSAGSGCSDSSCEAEPAATHSR